MAKDEMPPWFKDEESEDDKIKRYLAEDIKKSSRPGVKLDVFRVLQAVDKKDREFFDSLTEVEQKAFVPFVLVRWMSTVESNVTGMDEYWLRAVNRRMNTNLLNLKINDDPHWKLQWLMATAASPDMGQMRHAWIGYKKKTKDKTKKIHGFLSEQYPHLSDEEVNLLIEINDTKSLKAYLKDLGLNDRRIKQLFRV